MQPVSACASTNAPVLYPDSPAPAQAGTPDRPLRYYNADGTVRADEDRFFAAIPRRAQRLVSEGKLKRDDVFLLTLLLDHKNKQHTLVGPTQRTLAREMGGVSVDLVQDCAKRLVEHGFIDKLPQRDHQMRWRGLLYDLAKTLRMLPSGRGGGADQAAPQRHGSPPTPDTPPAAPVPAESVVADGEGAMSPAPLAAPALPARPLCGGAEEKGDVLNIKATGTAPHSPAAWRLVQCSRGAATPPMSEAMAQRLVREHGPETCLQALRFLDGCRRKPANPAGFLVAAVRGLAEGSWQRKASPQPPAESVMSRARREDRRQRAAAERKAEQERARLDALPAQRLAELEARARAQLAESPLPAIRKALAEGSERGAALLRATMLRLLPPPAPG